MTVVLQKYYFLYDNNAFPVSNMSGFRENNKCTLMISAYANLTGKRVVLVGQFFLDEPYVHFTILLASLPTILLVIDGFVLFYIEYDRFLLHYDHMNSSLVNTNMEHK